jgi:transcriptional regulator with XRE-family HTH domain
VRTLSEQLRQAIAASGITRYEIAKATGVSQSTLSKFMLRQRGISIEAMDAVGLFLGLRLSATSKKRTQNPTTGAR